MVSITTFCPLCEDIFTWVEEDNNNSENFILKCLECNKSILQFNALGAAKILSNLLKKYHPQIVSTFVNLVITAAGNFYSKSSPSNLQNPFCVLDSIYTNENPDFIFMGGSDMTTIFADIYIDKNLKCPPILYLTTRGTLQQRCFYSGLKYNRFPDNAEKYLHEELLIITLKAIKNESNLVIGRILEKLIDLKSINSIKPDTLKIVTFTQLKSLKSNDEREYSVADNLREITKNCRKFCDTVNRFVDAQIIENCDGNDIDSNDVIFDLQSKALNAAVWIIEFYGCPLMRCLDVFDRYTH